MSDLDKYEARKKYKDVYKRQIVPQPFLGLSRTTLYRPSWCANAQYICMFTSTHTHFRTGMTTPLPNSLSTNTPEISGLLRRAKNLASGKSVSASAR